MSNSQPSTLNSQLIPPGYKQTEVGVIPEEWNAKPLKGRVSIAHGFAFASQYFASNGNYRLTTPGHFYEEGGFRDIGDKQKYYTGPVPSDYMLEPGDLIVAMTEQADGLLGSAALIPAVAGYLHNQRLGRVKTLTSEVHLPYLFWVFNSASYRSKVRETAAGTKVKHTSPAKLLEISVRLPPEREQRAIAEALSDVDGLLGGLDRLIAKKRDFKQAAMQQLLTGQTHLPGFHGEWEATTLGRCLFARPDYGINAPAVQYSDRLPTYLRITDISDDGRFRPDPRVSVKAAGADQFYLREGEIVFARTGASVGKSYLYGPRDGELVFAGFLIRVKPNPERLVPAFLAAFATTKPYWDWVRFMSMRSGQPGINGNEYGQMPLLLPGVPEQTAIAEVLREMDAELAGLDQRREKTRALKQAMTQELLTGKTRLVEPNAKA